MDRRDLLKVLGGAVAVAAFPLPSGEPLPQSYRPMYYRDGDKAFVVIRAPYNVRTGEIVMVNGKMLGVAKHDARRMFTVAVQVYGPATVITRAALA